MEEIKDKDYSLEAVPESARKGFRSMFFEGGWKSSRLCSATFTVCFLSCLDLPSFLQV